MAFSVYILEDGGIEITRPIEGKKTRFAVYGRIESALIVIKYLIRKDREEARGNQFVPQFVKEARLAFKQLSERSPYNGKK
jgi:hypothetical protein